MVRAKLAESPGPDEELVAAIESGDRKRALTLLMEQFGEEVFRNAVSRTGDPNLAEDVRQQVFLEANRDLAQLSSPAAARAWLLGITRHRSLDAVNERKRWWHRFKNAPPAAEDDEPGAAAWSSIEALEEDQTIDRRVLARFLKRCLDKLPPAAREAVVLRHQNELTYGEVAEIVGGPAGTVQRRVSRAFVALRKCLKHRMRGGRNDDL